MTVVIKSISGFVTLILQNITALRQTLQSGILGILGLLIAVLLTIFAVMRRASVVFRPIGRRLARGSQRTVQRAGSSATGAMARRSQSNKARAEIDTGIAEDPLRRQNRILSAMVILALAALVVIIVWATSNSDDQAEFTPSSQNLGLAANPTTPPEVEEDVEPVGLTLPTAVPTATDLPGVLQSRGTVAFVVREDAQTDIWATPIDTLRPLRLTNSPGDERDPAFSPDGTKLAYASNKNGNWDIYIYDILSDQETQMTFNLAFEAGPRWSPDGEFLVYESYQEGTHLDIYIMRVDGAPISTPRVPESSATADYSPAWSPDGSKIAFVSLRGGSQDIYIFTIADSSIYNLTNSPDRLENYPVWSPNGQTLAYSAKEAGRELIYTQPVNPGSTAQIFRQGRTPAWSPDGASIVFAADTSTATLFTVAPFTQTGVATEAFTSPTIGAYHPTWTANPLPAALVNSGGLPKALSEPLYIEAESEPLGDPPYGLQAMVNIQGPDQPVLSERVDDSFQALRVRANELIGYDFLGRLSDVFWDINYRPPVGEESRNWHKTGRAIAFNRNRIVGFPPEVEIVREDTDLATLWRVYIRVADEAQDGQLGEPLRVMPWDFERETAESFERGGSPKGQLPDGYYVDLTQLANDFGWQSAAAGNDWRDNFNSRNYWMFQKRDGLTWYDAMREIYTVGELGGFNPTPTPNNPVDTSNGG